MFISEKELIYNEVRVYCTNLPDREPPTLYGVMLWLSGSVDEFYTSPAAAKVAFRHIGKPQKLAEKYPGMARGQMEKTIRANFPPYLDPKTVTAEDTRHLLQTIRNVIKEDAVLLALIMKGIR